MIIEAVIVGIVLIFSIKAASYGMWTFKSGNTAGAAAVFILAAGAAVATWVVINLY